MSNKLAAGSPMPVIELPAVGGGQATLGGGGDGYQLIVIYRGRHCPICKRYLSGLTDLLGDFRAANTEVVAVSADPQAKAEADVAEFGWPIPIAYGLGMEDMRRLGLYISEPRSEKEMDRPFPEPAVFVVNPAGMVQIIDLSNAPWSRPDLAELLRGIRHIQEVDYPIRGTLS